MAKLKRKRAYVNPSDVDQWIDKVEDNTIKGIDPNVVASEREAKEEQRKVEAADYADMRNQSSNRGLDQETRDYVRRKKDATIEPIGGMETPNIATETLEEAAEIKMPEVVVTSTDGGRTFGVNGSGNGGSNIPPPPGMGGPTGPSEEPWWKKTTRAAGTAMVPKFESAKQKFTRMDSDNKKDEDNDIDEFEKPLGISDGTADMYAGLCGSTRSIKVLRSEYQELKRRSKRLQSETDSYSMSKRNNEMRLAQLATDRDSVKAEWEAENIKLQALIVSKASEVEIGNQRDRVSEVSARLTTRRAEYNQLANELSRTGSEYRFSQKAATLRNDLNALKDEFNKYYRDVACGQEKYKKSHGWRQEAKTFNENTLDMIGKPTVNPVTDIVGYGGMTGKTAVGGLNAIAGGYKVSDSANSWTRTNVGDRQLVESLVTVRPSRMITPFGAPGTVGESNLQNQFQYSSPLKRIGVGDVTARGGYQINIEDIHRKAKRGKPKINRKVIVKKKVMGKNVALDRAVSMVQGQRIIDIKVPTVSIKGTIKGANGEKSIKGISTLNIMKEMTLGKSNMNIELKGINNIMAKAVEATKKVKKVKK